LPPVPIQYEVTGKVLVEPQRVEGLVKNLKRTTLLTEPTVLRDFKVLARSQAEPDLGLARFHESDRVFLKLKSLWNERCSQDDFQKWADAATRSTPKIHQNSEMASAVRKARWELVAAEHYQKHHGFLHSDSQLASNESGRFQLAGLEGSPSNAQLVANTLGPGSAVDSADKSDPARSDGSVDRQQMEANVLVAQQRLETLESELQKELQKATGAVTLMDPPVVVPVADRIPFWMALSVIVILLSVGSLVGWYHLRLQSGGFYDPQDVASQLASQGMTVVARVSLPSDQLDSSDWLEIASRQASATGRRTGRNLTYLSEGMLTFWCCIMLARFSLDPMWRMVLLDSPLAAFGRLIAGLP